MIRCFFVVLCLAFSAVLPAQVYSPNLLRKGQPDATDLQKFAEGICLQAHARTPRERAEAIWRFFLTDGRFVKPGFWYHIAGWTYEEPSGEVLDPMKLLNSYGFGLCYHIAPLLEAVYEAAGFKDARCWFLTGHTVTEVFYDGRYHYFDSDMMGYNVAGDGPFQNKPVASVRDLELHPDIILGKLAEKKKVKEGAVDDPWYPADVRADAMDVLANLFTTTQDNYLYPYNRYSSGHAMDFELRPGETLTRFFRPEEPGLYYLPYRFDGKTWNEFPQEFAEYQISTNNGPRSQKDDRIWATGRFDYSPPAVTQAVTVIPMPSPYVIIDAHFEINASVSAGEKLQVATSIDNGLTWTAAGELRSSYTGKWTLEPNVVQKTQHGRLTAVSGSYGYQVRITKSDAVKINSLLLTSRVQLNPRALPFVESGSNEFVYNSQGPAVREEISDTLAKAKLSGMKRIDESGQSLLMPTSLLGEAVWELSSSQAGFSGFDVGARFLDLRDGLAPDKLTAETRHTAVTTLPGSANVAWATSISGPYHELWKYDQQLTWNDNDVIDRMLRWPQMFQQVRTLPAGTNQLFVKVSSSGPAIDDIRIATYSQGAGTSPLKITQVWRENGKRHEHKHIIKDGGKEDRYTFTAGEKLENLSVAFSVDKKPGQ